MTYPEIHHDDEGIVSEAIRPSIACATEWSGGRVTNLESLPWFELCSRTVKRPSPASPPLYSFPPDRVKKGSTQMAPHGSLALL
jgi:hypothetical protein